MENQAGKSKQVEKIRSKTISWILIIMMIMTLLPTAVLAMPDEDLPYMLYVEDTYASETDETENPYQDTYFPDETESNVDYEAVDDGEIIDQELPPSSDTDFSSEASDYDVVYEADYDDIADTDYGVIVYDEAVTVYQQDAATQSDVVDSDVFHDGWFYGVSIVPTSGFTITPMIAASSRHTVALREDGTVWAWGSNWDGELGDGTTIHRRTPVPAQGINDVVEIAVGNNHTVALRNDGTVWAWGWNGLGQIGDGTTIHRQTPVQVYGLTNIIAITAGANHTVALRDDGTVWAWGINGRHQLGDGTGGSGDCLSLVPVQVYGLTNVIAISAGREHTLALRNDGIVWAWGASSDGQLGNGTTEYHPTPVQVQLLNDVVAIAAGGSHSVALRKDGTVWGWGDNFHGQLGDGTWGTVIGGGSRRHLLPIQVQGLTDITAISTGSGHIVALREDGIVWALGYNGSGQIGDGTSGPPNRRLSPVQVQGGLNDVIAITAGNHHTLAIRKDGTVWACAQFI